MIIIVQNLRNVLGPLIQFPLSLPHLIKWIFMNALVEYSCIPVATKRENCHGKTNMILNMRVFKSIVDFKIFEFP